MCVLFTEVVGRVSGMVGARREGEGREGEERGVIQAYVG